MEQALSEEAKAFALANHPRNAFTAFKIPSVFTDTCNDCLTLAASFDPDLITGAADPRLVSGTLLQRISPILLVDAYSWTPEDGSEEYTVDDIVSDITYDEKGTTFRVISVGTPPNPDAAILDIISSLDPSLSPANLLAQARGLGLAVTMGA